jgi:hypothetical protein
LRICDFGLGLDRWIFGAGASGAFTLTANCHPEKSGQDLPNCQLIRAKVVFSKNLERGMEEGMENKDE